MDFVGKWSNCLTSPHICTGDSSQTSSGRHLRQGLWTFRSSQAKKSGLADSYRAKETSYSHSHKPPAWPRGDQHAQWHSQIGPHCPTTASSQRLHGNSIQGKTHCPVPNKPVRPTDLHNSRNQSKKSKGVSGWVPDETSSLEHSFPPRLPRWTKKEKDEARFLHVQSARLASRVCSIFCEHLLREQNRCHWLAW